MPDTFGACAYEREYSRLSAVDELVRQDTKAVDNLRRKILDCRKAAEKLSERSRAMWLVGSHLRTAHHYLLEHQREQPE